MPLCKTEIQVDCKICKEAKHHQDMKIHKWQDVPEGMVQVPTHTVRELLDNYDLTGDVREILIDCIKSA